MAAAATRGSKAPWVPAKPVDFAEVERLLGPSIESNQMTNGGPCSRMLEETAARLLEIPEETHRVVACCNGAVALDMLAAAVDIHRASRSRGADGGGGGAAPLRYATQSFTFPSSAQGVFHGRTTIVDITAPGEGGGDLDLSAVPEGTNGLVVTNVFGTAGDVRRYVDWWREDPEDRVLLFDNAASPLTFDRTGTNLCALGTGSIVSLHHTKPIGFGEGGLIVVQKHLETAVRRAINFGLDRVVPRPWHPLGGNGKMSDVAAAFCLLRLRRAREVAAHAKRLLGFARRWIARSSEETARGDDLRLLLDEEARKHGVDVTPAALCVVTHAPDVATRALKRIGEEAGVEARQYYRPLDFSSDRCPNAVRTYESIVCLPCHEEVSEEQIGECLRILEGETLMSA